MVENALRTVRRAWEIKLNALKKCEKEIERRQKAKKVKEKGFDSEDSVQLSEVSQDESCCEHSDEKKNKLKISETEKLKAMRFHAEHKHFGIKAVDLEDLE